MGGEQMTVVESADALVVLITVASREEAERIARRLVEDRLAACVNIVSQVRSFFIWQRSEEHTSELQSRLHLVCRLLLEKKKEIALAREHRLPHLVEVKDISGGLQMHTSATDGKGTIEDMAHAARALGYEYVAITDHSKRVTMALGLDAKRLREQWKAIDAWND